jgi:Uma2 family endonuclease
MIDDRFLPATLIVPPMNDEEFEELCAPFPDLRFEMSADGDLLVMAPSTPMAGVRRSHFLGLFGRWAMNDQRGVTCDSSTGFVLPNGARRSPSLSWTLKSRIAELDSPEGFWHLCPDFVMELKSPSDRLRTLKAKMTEYMENGAQLGWLIDPEARSVSIYRSTGEVEIHTNIDSLTATEPLTGFTLHLTPVWNPF